MNYDFRERVVLVTGAASGIGRATAEAFARAGASVALTSRDMQQLETIAMMVFVNKFAPRLIDFLALKVTVKE